MSFICVGPYTFHYPHLKKKVAFICGYAKREGKRWRDRGSGCLGRMFT